MILFARVISHPNAWPVHVVISAEMKIQTEGDASIEPPSFDPPSADSSDNEGGDDAWMYSQRAGEESDEDNSNQMAGRHVEPMSQLAGAPIGSSLVPSHSPSPARPQSPQSPVPSLPSLPKAQSKAKPKPKRRRKAPAKKRRIFFSQRRDGGSEEEEEEEDDDCSNYSSDSGADAGNSESEEEEEQPHAARPSPAASQRARPQPAKAASKSTAVAASAGASTPTAGSARGKKRGASASPSRPARTHSAPSIASSRSLGSLTQPAESMEDDYTPVVEAAFGQLRVLRTRRRTNRDAMRGGFVYSQT
jgi:outer membrane biosynthesis protein TonB